jgi:hypothetical protein
MSSSCKSLGLDWLAPMEATDARATPRELKILASPSALTVYLETNEVLSFFQDDFDPHILDSKEWDEAMLPSDSDDEDPATLRTIYGTFGFSMGRQQVFIRKISS